MFYASLSVHEISDSRWGSIVVVQARAGSHYTDGTSIVRRQQGRRGSNEGEVELDVAGIIEEGERLLVECNPKTTINLLLHCLNMIRLTEQLARPQGCREQTL